LDSLLIGDKNAILVAARSSGFGHDYEAKVNCANCGTANLMQFDLRDTEIVGLYDEEIDLVNRVSPGVFSTKMPLTQFTVEFRLMNSSDEKMLQKEIQKASEDREQNLLTGQFKRIIVSVEGHTDQSIIDKYVENMPTVDSRHFKTCIKCVTPNVEIKKNLKCKNCSAEREVDVPYGTSFFWPDL